MPKQQVAPEKVVSDKRTLNSMLSLAKSPEQCATESLQPNIESRKNTGETGLQANESPNTTQTQSEPRHDGTTSTEQKADETTSTAEDEENLKRWRASLSVENPGPCKKRRVDDKIWRKIMIPVELNPSFDYAQMLIGPGGKTIKDIMAKSGGRVTIKVRGKGCMSSNTNEPLHVVLEGESSCVYKAESLIYELLNIPERARMAAEQGSPEVNHLNANNFHDDPCDRQGKEDIVTRKIVIPEEHYRNRAYMGLLIGPGGSRSKALMAKAGGRVGIRVFDETHDINNEPPYVEVRGKRWSVDKAQSMIHELLRVPEKEIWRKIMIPVERNPEFDYVGFILGPGASKVKAMKAEAGGQVRILVRGRGKRGINNNDDGPLHVLIEGEPSCVHKAESMICELLEIPERDRIPEPMVNANNDEYSMDNVCNEPDNNYGADTIVTREVTIPIEHCVGRKYVDLLIGPGGSIINSLVDKTRGQVKIQVCDDRSNIRDFNNRQPFVLLKGDRVSVDRAETLVNDILRVPVEVSRKILIPSELYAGRRYVSMLIGPGGSIIKSLVAKTDGRVNIRVCDDRNNMENGPPFVLLEGDRVSVDKAESLIDDILQLPERGGADTEDLRPMAEVGIPNPNTMSENLDERHSMEEVITRKIVIPVEHYRKRTYMGLLIGPGGSKNKELVAKAGGKVRMRVFDEIFDNNQPPFVELKGERWSVDKAEMLVNELFKVPENEVWRKIVIPVERNPEYDYIGLILGPGASRIQELQTEAGGKVRILVRGKGIKGIFRNDDEPLHVLLEGEPSCVHKAESLINDLLQIPERERADAVKPEMHESFHNVNNETGAQYPVDSVQMEPDMKYRADIVSCKVAIPSELCVGRRYVDVLIGPGGSIINSIVAETEGRVNIQICDDNNQNAPFVLLEGDHVSVNKAESLINEIFRVPAQAETENTMSMPDMNISNANNDSRSLIDRVETLQSILGVKLNTADTLKRKVAALEIELLGNAQKGTLTERISALENETG